jgi:hypothetical protein
VTQLSTNELQEDIMSRYIAPKLDTKGELVENTKGIPQTGVGDTIHPTIWKMSAVGSVGYNL